jgi:hypothetical protein
MELSIQRKEMEVTLAQQMFESALKEETIHEEEEETFCDVEELPCEFWLDLEENDIDRQIHNEQLKREKERLYWKGKREKLEGLMALIQSKIDQTAQDGDNGEIAIHKLELENAALESQIEEMKRELAILKEQLRVKAAATTQMCEDSAELKRILSLEEGLERQAMELELEEEILAVEEAQFSTVKANLEEDKAIIQATDASNKALMNLYRGQLKLAQNQSKVDRAIEKLAEPYTAENPSAHVRN